ncbi:MAG TPA: phospholipase D-like domain-containing protein [Candidatus Saccharibacteria bacterium]|nr:phospholipase D-like domain-containing protein [Candidatus Saccharibacteria bacterium]
MINLFLRYKSMPATHDSRFYNEKDFYDAFASDINSASSSVVIESPYLTERRARQYAKLIKRKAKSGVRIHIYTRNPLHHDRLLAEQSNLACRILKDAGARVFVCDDMRHRKLAIIDAAILWEGSLNILSQSNSAELMRRTHCKEQALHVLKLLKLKRI